MDLDPIDEFTNDIPVATELDNITLEAGPALEMRWSIDKGVTRENDEDSLAAVTLNHASETASQPIGVYMVANGMGGHEAGEDMMTPYQQWLDDGGYGR